MKFSPRPLTQVWLSLLVFISACFAGVELSAAQGSQFQEKLTQVKEAAASNKQALAQYTWVEQVTISLKGEQKKQEHFQVRLGPDGKPQKTSLDSPQAAEDNSGGGRRGRLKEHVVEKKKEEYKEYADRIKALIQEYVPPDRDAMQQAFQSGNASLGSAGDASGRYRLVFSNYIKQGDNMTLLFDPTQKALTGVSINTYMDDPKDAVEVTVQFSTLPGEPNHVSTETINGISKQLTIAIQNGNYQRL